jgi:hypothetical protein
MACCCDRGGWAIGRRIFGLGLLGVDSATRGVEADRGISSCSKTATAIGSFAGSAGEGVDRAQKVAMAPPCRARERTSAQGTTWARGRGDGAGRDERGVAPGSPRRAARRGSATTDLCSDGKPTPILVIQACNWLATAIKDTTTFRKQTSRPRRLPGLQRAGRSCHRDRAR